MEKYNFIVQHKDNKDLKKFKHLKDAKLFVKYINSKYQLKSE